jgi:coiled-coil and C2 domain-containing protein 1
LPAPPPSLPINQNNIKPSPQIPDSKIPKTSEEQDIEIPNVELNTEEAKKLFNAPPPPNTVMEALEQRLAKFKSTLEQAKEEDNAGKVRRLGRIVKQYENAIKDVKKGKQVDFEELPTPPGICH